MMKLAARLLKNQQMSEELVNESFLILLYKRKELEHHPNLPGWLNQTLKNLILNELNSARHRLEIPLIKEAEVAQPDIYRPQLSELLPPELTQKESEILIMFFEEQLSYDQIAVRLHISVLNCRTRLFRAKAHFKELIENKNYNYQLFL